MVRLPYLGQVGHENKKPCFKKVQKCLTEKVCFFTRHETKKLAIRFVQPKALSHTPKIICCLLLNMSWIINKYIGKIDRNLVTHLNNQGSRDDQPMYQRLSKFEHYIDIVSLMKLPDTYSTTVAVDKKSTC